MTQRNRAWRRRQQRLILQRVMHSHLWLWNQLFADKAKLPPTSDHRVNPKKTQPKRLDGPIQAVRESHRANGDVWETA